MGFRKRQESRILHGIFGKDNNMMLSGLMKTYGIMPFLWVSLIFIMDELPRLSTRAMAEDNRSRSSIEKISVNRSTVTIEGRCDIESKRPRFLAELAPHHSKNDLANAQIIQQVELDGTGFFRMSFPRWSDDRDRILSRFFLTSGHSQPLKKLTRLLGIRSLKCCGSSKP